MMSLNYRFRFIPLIIIILIFPLALANISVLGGLGEYIKFELSDKSALALELSLPALNITSISIESNNVLPIKARVTDKNGVPVAGARLKISAVYGHKSISASAPYTGGDGSVLFTYRPSVSASVLYNDGGAKETVTVSIAGTETKSEVSFFLINTPVVFVHGYQANSDLFDNFKEYLESNSHPVELFNYDSEKGVAYGAEQLEVFLDNTKHEYLNKNIQVKGFNLITHSMGGLVARYYTCQKDYMKMQNVNKIIFISVPQNGSALASLGLKYYTDRGIQDLAPESALFSSVFPEMINRGLNRKIQTGSIIGQYDEVVSLDSSSLEEWGIKTELFNVGENNFTVDKLLSGKITEAANHKSVLYNKKVFKRVTEMLETNLPYPSEK